MKQTKKHRYHQMINECLAVENLIYLTIECSTRSKLTARKCKQLLNSGNFADALRIGDPIAYNLGLSEFN